MRTEILVTGGGGLLGSAVKKNCPEARCLTRRDCDLRDFGQVERLFERLKPQSVLHLAAHVGGVKSNAEKNADLFTENVQINTNVLSAAQKYQVERLIAILSTCAFPSCADRPLTEEDLHRGMPYEGNLGYGFSKRMLDLHARLLGEQYHVRFTTILPVTMYGPHDNWDLGDSHVLGALIHKCFLAKRRGTALEVWGSGEAVRQFVYAEDVARLLTQLLDKIEEAETMIVAADEGIRIGDLARRVAQAMKFSGPVVFDKTKPEGQRVKVVKSTKFARRFPRFKFTPLEEGLIETVKWFEAHYEEELCAGKK